MSQYTESEIEQIKAEAWEEGCREGLSYNPGYDDEALASNPYRIEGATDE